MAETNPPKSIGSWIMQLMPYGLIRLWLLHRLGYKIDEPLLYYPGVKKCLKRLMKFMLPYCITMRYRTPYSEQSTPALTDTPIFDAIGGVDSSYSREFANISECLNSALRKISCMRMLGMRRK